MPVAIGKKQVGEQFPCFITFEAGPTHDGLETAKKLVKEAARAGADAIKFQILDPDRLVADKDQLFSYNVLADRATGRTEPVSEPLYDILCRRALTKEQWQDVKSFSDSQGLAFFATVGFPDEVALLEEIGCHSIKIASGDVNHFPLIRLAARTGMCIQLDTGNSSLGEIESAVDVILSEGNENIIIHQCPSGYPAHMESINLRIIHTLKQMFPFPVAFSDHTPGWDMDIAAVAMGANLVEKTITFDRTTRSVEHMMSLEPEEMAVFVQSIRNLETALGSPRRLMTEEERKKRMAVRRSVFLAEAVKKGQKLGDAMVDFRRPGFGIGPDQYEQYREATFYKDLPAEHRLCFQDLYFK